MKLEIEIRESPGKDTYALCLVLPSSSRSSSEPDQGLVIELQSGYRSPQQAMTALLESWTVTIPDISHLEEAAGHVGQLLDGINNINEAITILGDRLNTMDESIEALQAGTSAPRSNPLLRARPNQQPVAAGNPPSAPPALRQPRVGVPHGEILGGAFRPGEQGEGEG